jgi:hypothetical protein
MVKDTYTIGNKVFNLESLKGKKARRMLPRIMEIASAVFNLAASNGVDVISMFGKGSNNPSFSDLTKAMYAVSSFFKDEYDSIETDIFPILLCVKEKDWVWIDENATPGDLYSALWVAIQYHLESSFGVDVQKALKNLPEAPAEAPAEASVPQSDKN